MSHSLPIAEPPSVAESPLGLIDALLSEQQSLTAVDRFSAEHDVGASMPAQARYYRNLLPATAPKPGQQYGFEVDLDACSGCKACVVACHTMNGLQEEETWRKVGLLSGGSESRVQHVTTACHHCVEPGCLAGCPVQAYEKDPQNGVVRHLDDQCIGCKYCTMMCPYEVPQYSDSLGIVRKCDMCHQRLAVGEAPACVQSCPNEAIRIALVDVAEAREWAEEADAKLVPGAPSSALTTPTTQYVGRVKSRHDLVAQDQSADHVAESHWPLALMLALTQVSVGLLVAERLVSGTAMSLGVPIGASLLPATLLLSLLIGGIGLNLAALHLGQPRKAWRVFLGLRTSWLSREAVVLGGYATLLAAATALAWAPSLDIAAVQSIIRQTPGWLLPILQATTIVAGLAGIYCSAMIYIATRRQLWRRTRTFTRFFGTAVVAGGAALLPLLVAGDVHWLPVMLVGLLSSVAVASKTLWERQIHLGTAELNDRYDERSRRLARRSCLSWTRCRLWAAGVGVTGLLLATFAAAIADSSSLAFAFGVAAAVCVIAGEVVERLLYFCTVVHDRMPRTVS